MSLSNNSSIRDKHVTILDTEFNDIRLSRQIEKQLYNASIRVARERYIKRSWGNLIFEQLYISKIRSFYSNISTTSYVNNPNFKQKLSPIIRAKQTI